MKSTIFGMNRIFNSKKDKSNYTFSSPSDNMIHSVLSLSVTITGDIKSKDDLRIDGRIEGNIHCEGKVIIGTNGHVIGDIESQYVEVMGKAEGNIKAHDIIKLKATSFYKGDLTTVNIEIEPGANFFGNCKMLESSLKNNSIAQNMNSGKVDQN